MASLFCVLYYSFLTYKQKKHKSLYPCESKKSLSLHQKITVTVLVLESTKNARNVAVCNFM